ncbi:YjdF family protein [Fructilactobacillus ixorae]|uniref:YjdF family protein n=1 Tax=Fructilactobacillus ixorae TaxID=1750535 RepID=A0ABY5C472_9LACO|nr:YjdF family protein [Fructilactobacillus ixorae]USS92978.1 YjdF family protein [Fructilactobacillus ixorae]
MFVQSQLTIIFDGSFYRGIFEVNSGKNYQVEQIILGSSVPSLPQLCGYLNHHYHQLHFTEVAQTTVKHPNKINPKRQQRAVQKQLKQKHPVTKAQAVLQTEFEQKKVQRKRNHSQLKREHQQQQFELKQQKRKQKHRGH